MKIGILTFHGADNYGAVLQAYALQNTLEELGAESEFIVIDTGKSAANGAEAPKMQTPLAKRIALAAEQRAALFAGFRERRLKLSKAYAGEECLALAAQYDLFIAGSDQVWNFAIPEVDARYFLPFAPPEKRFAYAASFGSSSLPPQAEAWCAAELKKFQAISVREKEGQALVKRLTGREAQLCLDPTLLMNAAKWASLASPPREQPPYLLMILLQYDETLVAAAKKTAAERNLKLRAITSGFMPQLGFEAWSGSGVEDWIAAIRDADSVLTNSFHASVFSILFQKPFSVYLLGGSLNARNGRLTELLTTTGLRENHEGCAPRGADWNDVFARLEKSRKESLDFLKELTKK